MRSDSQQEAMEPKEATQPKRPPGAFCLWIKDNKEEIQDSFNHRDNNMTWNEWTQKLWNYLTPVTRGLYLKRASQMYKEFKEIKEFNEQKHQEDVNKKMKKEEKQKKTEIAVNIAPTFPPSMNFTVNHYFHIHNHIDHEQASGPKKKLESIHSHIRKDQIEDFFRPIRNLLLKSQDDQGEKKEEDNEQDEQ